MFPATPGDYCVDSASGQQVSGGNVANTFAKEMRSSYRADVIFRQSSTVMFGADRPPLPTLSHLVSHVVAKRPKKEMCWITAEAVIATVQNAQAFGDLAKRQLKCPPICSLDLSVTVLAPVCDTVSATRCFGSGPIPAFISSPALYARPEYRRKFAVGVLFHPDESTTAVTREV